MRARSMELQQIFEVLKDASTRFVSSKLASSSWHPMTLALRRSAPEKTALRPVLKERSASSSRAFRACTPCRSVRVKVLPLKMEFSSEASASLAASSLAERICAPWKEAPLQMLCRKSTPIKFAESNFARDTSARTSLASGSCASRKSTSCRFAATKRAAGNMAPAKEPPCSSSASASKARKHALLRSAPAILARRSTSCSARAPMSCAEGILAPPNWAAFRMQPVRMA
mmetsp:Transcript_32540/g.53439  ORF Transcript_32540/g.53439 Transcript_32540/m.53439 type:complete len:229 (+) Transcript_32540:141-827(+)